MSASSRLLGAQDAIKSNKHLDIGKEHLKKITNWKFKAKLQGNEFRIELYYQVIIRNKIVNNNLYPIFVQHDVNLPSPQMVRSV